MVCIMTGIAFIAVILFLCRSGYERKHFRSERFTLATEKLKAGEKATFVFLSDLHDNEFGSDNQDLVAAIKALQPDFILVGGDMMVCKGKKNIRIAVNLMEQLSPICPIYYSNGNHETRMRANPEIYGSQYEEYRAALKALGIYYLASETALYPLAKGSHLEIGGVDLQRQHYKKPVSKMEPEYLHESLGGANKSNVQITMIHSPLFIKEAARWGSDLVLSGHFHGGTIRIPGFRGLMSPQLQFFPKYGGGEYTYKGTKMIVSRGLGTHSINIRFNNLPQLVVVDVLAQDDTTKEKE